MTEPLVICDSCMEVVPVVYPTENGYEICEDCLKEFEQDPEEAARRIAARNKNTPTLGGKPPFPYRSE